MTERALTPMQAAFVAEYLVDLNATQAAVRAGYSAKTAEQMAYQLLQKTSVQNAIQIERSKRSERTKVNQDYVLNNLTEVVERCMQRAPVMTRADGVSVQLVDDEGRHVWNFDARSAVSSLNLIGKHLGMFGEQVTVKDADSPMRDIEGLSDKEKATKLLGLLGLAAARMGKNV